MKSKLMRRTMAAVLAGSMVFLCAGTVLSAETETEVTSQGDQAAADAVADLIDAIYVQERTDDADELCRAAKEAWDNLT